MTDDPLVIALEDVACTGLRRGHVDVYRFAMGAVSLLNEHAMRHRDVAEVVLDVCRATIARSNA